MARMAMIKLPSHFACAKSTTTAATLSSIWFQPSTWLLFFAPPWVHFQWRWVSDCDEWQISESLIQGSL